MLHRAGARGHKSLQFDGGQPLPGSLQQIAYSHWAGGNTEVSLSSKEKLDLRLRALKTKEKQDNSGAVEQVQFFPKLSYSPF